MNQKTLTQFKNLFESQKKKLLFQDDHFNEDYFLKTDDLKDEVDQTSAAMDQALRLRLRNREALFLKKINAALSRIRNGSFGLCDDCEEEIELKRLKARPTTTLCVICKEERELKEKSFADGRKRKSLGKSVKLHTA